MTIKPNPEPTANPELADARRAAREIARRVFGVPSAAMRQPDPLDARETNTLALVAALEAAYARGHADGVARERRRKPPARSVCPRCGAGHEIVPLT